MRADQGARLDDARARGVPPRRAAARDGRARVRIAGDARLDEEGHQARTGVRHRGEVPASRHRRPLQSHRRVSGRAARERRRDARRREAAARVRPGFPGGAVLLPAVSRHADHRRAGARRAIRCRAASTSGPRSRTAARGVAVGRRRASARCIERFSFYQRIGWAQADAVAGAASGGGALALPPRSLRVSDREGDCRVDAAVAGAS